jgi:hypothetical protein
MIGPQIPPELLKRPSHDEDEDDTDDDFGPKPFSHGGGDDSKVSLERDQEKNEEQPKIYGPQIPTELLNRPPPPREGDGDEVDHTPSDRSRLKASPSSPMASPPKRLIGPSIGPSYPPHYGLRIQDDSDDSDDDVGPKPLPTGMSSGITDGVREFMEKEERRRKQVEVGSTPHLKSLVRCKADFTMGLFTGIYEAESSKTGGMDACSPNIIRFIRMFVHCFTSASPHS